MSSIFWAVTFLVLLFIELITVNLVTVWFVTGALFALTVSLLVDNVVLEVFTFLLVSIITLGTTRPFLDRIRKRGKVALNSERVIGKCGLVLKPIEKHHPGEVKVMGSVWTAVSDCNIDVGEEVIILKIDGVKVKVEKICQKED